MSFTAKMCAILMIATTFTCQVAGANVPVVGDINPAKDEAEYKACKAADPATTFGATRYGTEGPIETLKYFECFSTRTDEGLIANVVFCQPGTCYGFSDEHCTESALPGPVDVPVSRVDALNVADFSELVVHSAYCGPNNVPRL